MCMEITKEVVCTVAKRFFPFRSTLAPILVTSSNTNSFVVRSAATSSFSRRQRAADVEWISHIGKRSWSLGTVPREQRTSTCNSGRVQRLLDELTKDLDRVEDEFATASKQVLSWYREARWKREVRLVRSSKDLLASATLDSRYVLKHVSASAHSH